MEREGGGRGGSRVLDISDGHWASIRRVGSEVSLEGDLCSSLSNFVHDIASKKYVFLLKNSTVHQMKKHVEHTSMLCLSCVAQQSNVMSIEPNWEARTLEHGTSLGATNGYDKTCCVTIFAAAQENGHDLHVPDTQKKQWKSSCQTSTNLLDTSLVTKLTEYLLEDAQNQGSMG